MRQKLMAGYAVVGAIAIVAYFAASGNPANLLYQLVGLWGLGGIILGVRRHRSSRRLGWYLVGG